MSKRPGMHHGGAAAGRPPHRSRIKQVVAVEAVITDDIMSQALQMSRYRGTHVTAMSRNQNPHGPIIDGGLRPRQRISLASMSRNSRAPPIANWSGQPLTAVTESLPMPTRRVTEKSRNYCR